MTNDQEVVLASLNTHGGRGADGAPFDLAAACRQFEAEIIALQEAWHAEGKADPVAEIAQALGAQLIRADLMNSTNLRTLGIASDTRRGRWGLAVLTMLPVITAEVISLMRAPGDITPRAALLVTVRLPGGRMLRIVNTHLTYRFTSPLQLLQLVRRLETGEIATVIAGDLNMPGPVAGLAVGYRPVVSGKTFPAHRPLLQLDQVLVDRQIAARGGEVLPPAGSDHLPVRARLRLA
ncbi:MAG TPA: endonuclease/exonuclease/phosphatase family protein [Streptosporangiaceae bacterium]